MAEILVLFRCGHTKPFMAGDKVEAPECPRCGTKEVMRVTAPAPRFTMGGAPFVQHTRAEAQVPTVPVALVPLTDADEDIDPKEIPHG